MDVYPNTNFNGIPRRESQTATVMENADPDGIGRIKVQFAWQKRFGGISPWLRIVSPHAGGDKGFHFIPEKGEEVLIGFEGGNAERPYVMGSMYNGGGKAGVFQNSNNDIKAMQSRSGNKLVFNDGEGSTTITDCGHAGLKMDGKGVFISQANEKFEIQVGNEKEIKNFLSIDKEGKIILKGEKIFELIIGKSSITLKEDGTIMIKGKNILINGTENLDTRSSKSQVILNDNAKIVGTKVDIN